MVDGHQHTQGAGTLKHGYYPCLESHSGGCVGFERSDEIDVWHTPVKRHRPIGNLFNGSSPRENSALKTKRWP